VDDAALTLRQVGNRLGRILDELVAGIAPEFAPVATEEYKKRYAAKVNPYGEAWEYRKGDENRKVSKYKFGQVTNADSTGFGLFVAGPNAKRSCVPFEPRGLGVWRAPFDEVVRKRLERLIRGGLR
jgi:hypothetical protein